MSKTNASSNNNNRPHGRPVFQYQVLTILSRELRASIHPPSLQTHTKTTSTEASKDAHTNPPRSMPQAHPTRQPTRSIFLPIRLLVNQSDRENKGQLRWPIFFFINVPYIHNQTDTWYQVYCCMLPTKNIRLKHTGTAHSSSSSSATLLFIAYRLRAELARSPRRVSVRRPSRVARSHDVRLDAPVDRRPFG